MEEVKEQQPSLKEKAEGMGKSLLDSLTSLRSKAPSGGGLISSLVKPIALAGMRFGDAIADGIREAREKHDAEHPEKK